MATTFTKATSADVTSRNVNKSFVYTDAWLRARSAGEESREALEDIITYLQERVTDAQKVVSQHKPTVDYRHKGFKAKARKVSYNWSDMTKQVVQVLGGRDIKALDKMENHQVLSKPHFGLFSHFDLQALLVGGYKNGSSKKYSGIENFPMTNYAYMAADDHGILFTLHGEFGEEYWLISTKEASNLITSEIKGEMKRRDNASNTGKAQKIFTHHQPVPYTETGVFPTESPISEYDGHTMIIQPTVLKDIDNVEHQLPRIRLSVTHEMYMLLVAPMMEYKKLGSQYHLHSEISTSLFGEGKLPADKNQMAQLHNLWYLLIQAISGDYRLKTKKEQEECFNPHTFLSIRNYTCEADIRDLTTHTACMAAYEAEQIRRAEERLAKAALRNAGGKQELTSSSTAPIVSEEDALGNLDDHPF